jgi:hypothetical protein
MMFSFIFMFSFLLKLLLFSTITFIQVFILLIVEEFGVFGQLIHFIMNIKNLLDFGFLSIFIFIFKFFMHFYQARSTKTIPVYFFYHYSTKPFINNINIYFHFYPIKTNSVYYSNFIA